MLKSDGTFNGEGSASLSLVSAIHSLGIEVPEAVTEESQTYQKIRASRQTAEREYGDAVSNLGMVPVDKFDDARVAVLNAASRLHAVMNGADNVLIDVASRRLSNQVYDASRGWEAEVVERFNEVVETYELNEVAGDLPNFADPGSYNVLGLGRQQGHAVDRWRTAAGQLHPLWSAYNKLAHFHGQMLGPVDSVDIATNLFTACVLGDPGSFGVTQSAATQMAAISFGADSVKAYKPIVPFVVPAMVGYDLHLSTLAGAAVIRGRIQHV